MTILNTSARRAALPVVAFILVAASGDPAWAADAGERIFMIPPMWVPLLAGVSTSYLTSLLTRRNARPWVKAILNTGLVALATVIETVAAHGGVVTGEMLDIAVVTFLCNLGIYFGFIRPGVVPPAATAPGSGIV